MQGPPRLRFISGWRLKQERQNRPVSQKHTQPDASHSVVRSPDHPRVMTLGLRAVSQMEWLVWEGLKQSLCLARSAKPAALLLVI